MSTLTFSRLIVVAGLFFLSTISYSQKTQLPGFYLTDKGDTVKGFFANGNQGNRSPDKVFFQSVGQDSKIELTPLNCLGFDIEGVGSYISYTDQRMTNPISFQSANEDQTDHFEEISAFLRLIGKTDHYNLYILEDGKRINLFYKKNGGAIKELIQKSAIVNNIYWESMTYKQQLREMFTGENMEDKINDLAYTEKSVANFLNKQSGGVSVQKKKNENEGLFVIAGLSSNSFEFNGTSSPDFVVREYTSNTVPVFGLGYFFSFKSKNDLFFLYPQIKIYSYKHESNIVYNSSYPAFSKSFQSSLIVSPGLHLGYRLIKTPTIKVYVTPGVNLLYLANNTQVDEAKLSATETKTTKTSLSKASALVDVQAMVLIGKKFLAWTAYNLPTSVANFDANSPKLTSFQLGLGYKLF